MHQLLVEIDALNGMDIVLSDMKPDNIVLVSHKRQPFKVKLINFGMALPVSEMYVGMNMQATSYRAPEVILGAPLSTAVDVWGVGCIMAFLYFGVDLFQGNCAYRRMRAMMHMLGQADDFLLSVGENTWQYFSS